MPTPSTISSPVLAKETAERVPAVGDCWGWFKVPGIWPESAGSTAGGAQQVWLAPWLEEHVVAKSFQQAWYNLGIYYTHQQALATQNNQPAAAKKARVLAVAAYTKAIAINPTSQVGKSADQGLKQLPK